jgi:hypothetical protein
MARDYTPKIAKVDLVHGSYYHGRCRNATVARWSADDQLFYHWRTKFGSNFVESIKHPEDDDIFDVFVVESLANYDLGDDFVIIPFPNKEA